MKTKNILILFACVLLAVFVLGATGLARMANAAEGDSWPASDRLIGVLITTEHLDLFDMDGYLNDHAGDIPADGEIDQAHSAAYEGRLYATLTETSYTNQDTGETTQQREYVFDGVEGIPYYCALFSDAEGGYRGNSGDEAICESNMAVHSTDAGDSLSLEGTIYVSIEDGPGAFYYNPIYQTAQGEVYTVTGSGMSYEGDRTVGPSGSQTLNETNTVTKNGETGEVSTEITVSVCYMERPVGVRVLQLDSESRVLSREEYAPGALPSALNVDAETAYILVETRAVGLDGTENTARELFQRSDEALSAFDCRDDGICVKRYCGLTWAA